MRKNELLIRIAQKFVSCDVAQKNAICAHILGEENGIKRTILEFKRQDVQIAEHLDNDSCTIAK